jgi:hypothetical protein
MKFLIMLPVLLSLVPAGVPSGAGRVSSAVPRVFQVRPQLLVDAAARLQRGEREFRDLAMQIRHRAEEALSCKPLSVMSSSATLTGADAHDFICPAPLWWPDPDQEDGLPYVWNREGKINPEYFIVGDQAAFNRVARAVADLALAYVLTEEERFAVHAAQLVRTWLLDPQTRMNPNLNHAWFEKGRNSGTGFGIMSMEKLPAVLDAVGMLQGSPAWTSGDRRGMAQWVGSYMSWLRTGELGKEAGKIWNRFGTQYDVQLAACALFVGDTALARQVIDASKRERIDRHIRRDGRQPYELEREITFANSAASVRYLFALATMGEQVGIDLWNYVGCEGGSIRKALDLIAPYADSTRTWPYPLEVDRMLLQPLLQQASMIYDDDEYYRLLARLPDGKDPSNQAYALYVAGKGRPQKTGRMFVYDRGVLDATRDRIASGDTTFTEGWRVMIQEANEALLLEPVSVLDKKLAPPSGDKHDFMSIGGYYWPDTTKPGGLPWIYRDGKVNPTLHEYGDWERFLAMSLAVQKLGIAYYMTGDERYALHGARLLRVWFLDPATRMNPHLRYSHAQPGVFEGSYYGIIQTLQLPGVVDAIGMIAESPSWSDADQRGMVEWCVGFLDWMLKDEVAQEAARVWNNHSVNYDVTAVSFALFTGRRGTARRILEAVKTERIARQIRDDGRLPFELERNRAWTYAVATLERFVRLASMGEHVGVDLWHYTSPGGSSIRKAIDYLAQYGEPGHVWPYADLDFEQHGNTPLARLRPILQRAMLAYGDRRYAGLAQMLPIDETFLRSQDPGFLFYPTDIRSDQ